MAVAGMGRSGVGIALAATKRGARVRVYDEKSADTPERIAELERLESAGIDVVTGWHGHLAGEDHDLLTASPGFRRDHPAIRDTLAAGKEVISEVEFAYRIATAPILAITGTNGKSTTTVMTWLALKATGVEAVLCGNLSGSGYPELTLTEAADSTPEDGFLVAEVSSFQLEWVRDFRPLAGCVTTVTPDHMDRHPTFRDYFDTKLRIFRKMGRGDTAVWNREEVTVPRTEIEAVLGDGAAIAPVPGEVTLSDSAIGWRGVELALDKMPLLGSHNVQNAMMALTMVGAARTRTTAAQAQAAVDAIRSMHALDYRMQNLGQKDGVLVVNNSMCTNPGAVIASSRSMRQHQILLMGGAMKGLDFGPVGEYLRQSGHTPVLFSEHRFALASSLGLTEVEHAESLGAAFLRATQLASSGHVIMLAPGCASADPYTNFRERGDDFSRMVSQWLNN